MTEAEELGLIRDAARLSGFLPELKEVIYKMERIAERKVLDALARGELTPEKALLAWQEKAIMRGILAKFDQKVLVGSSLASQHQNTLNNTE